MRRDVAGGVGDGQTRPDASASPTDESQRERSTQGGAIVGGRDVPYRATGLGRATEILWPGTWSNTGISISH